MLILLISLLTTLGINPPADKNISVIEENIVNGLMSEELNPFLSSDISDKNNLLTLLSQDDDGDLYFNDISYSINTSSSWRPRVHAQRLYYLTECCVKENDADEKEKLSVIVSSLMDYWLKKDYQSVNWWYNVIAMPNLIGQTAVLGKQVFSEQQMKKITEIVGRGCLIINPETVDLTGTNATDVAVSTIYYGVINNNRWAIKRAVNVLVEELRYSQYEGMKKDHTFFQHGNRLYIGDYGFTFIKNYVEILTILNGSEYNFSEKQLEPLSLFITEGIRKMSYGSTLDPTVRGRSISRSSAESLVNLEPYLRELLMIDNIPNKKEISDFADSILNNTRSDMGVTYFDESEFLVINNSDFYFSFRGGNENLYYSETINDENYLSYNSSFPGVTTIMGNGDEYKDITPVIDYSLIPGTTAIYENDSELMNHTDYTKRSLNGKFLSKSENGIVVSSVKTSHEGIDMTVSCFATDSFAVLLGTGMKNDSGVPMITTINQCVYNGNYIQSENEVVYSGVKYKILQGGNPDVNVENRTGSYRRNNKSESNTVISNTLISITLSDKYSYAYSVMSEKTVAEVKLVVNDEDVQAVELPDGKIIAVFFTPGSFCYNGRMYSSFISTIKIF